MPNPKSGTVTDNVADAVKDVKQGKISFKIDKFGIIHTSVGRVEFTPQQLIDNAREVLVTLSRMKPSAAKGIYFKSVFLASTMSPSLQVDVKSVSGL
jgi:large subunit ribosomal protein L1